VMTPSGRRAASTRCHAAPHSRSRPAFALANGAAFRDAAMATVP